MWACVDPTDILARTEGYEAVNHCVTITSPNPCRKLWTLANWDKYHHVLALQSSCFAEFDDVALRFYLRPHTRDITYHVCHTTMKFYSLWAELVKGETDQAFSAVIYVPEKQKYTSKRVGTVNYGSSFAFTSATRHVLVEQDLIFMESEYIKSTNATQGFTAKAVQRDMHHSLSSVMIIKIEVNKCCFSEDPMEDQLPKEHTSSFNAQIAGLFENVEEQKLSDVTLQMKNNEYLKAHKAILSARSSVFRAMFESGMKEAVNNIVDIPDISADAMRVVLKFVYSDKIDMNWITYPTDVVRAASKYDLPVLQQHVDTHLISCVTNENARKLFKMAELYNLETAKKQLMEYIENNTAAVLVSLDLED